MSKQAIDGATRINAFGLDPMELVIIGLDTDDGPEHPLYDERIKLPLDENLVLNIMEYGVLQVVRVQKDGDQVLVVDGRQRVRSAREANKRLKKAGSDLARITVLPVKAETKRVYGVMVSANEFRKDDGPMEKAAKLQRFLGLGNSEADALVTFGISRATLANLIALLNLDAVAKRAVDAGKISPSAAAQLGRLTREEQRTAVASMTAPGAVQGTKREAAMAVRQAKAGAGAEVSQAPAKRLVNRVLKLNKKEHVLTPDFVDGIMWVLGDMPASRIKGLTDLLRRASPGKPEAAE